MNAAHLSCSDCGTRGCSRNQAERFPAFCPTRNITRELLDEALACYKRDAETATLAREAALLESDYYCKMTRVEETIEFIKRMGYTKVGVASCIGLLGEMRTFSRILDSEGIEHHVVCCKIGATDKSFVGIPDERKLRYKDGQHESMCNPVMQAKALAEWGAELNILAGLCVGHDAIFIKHAEAPVTVMVVKDRVLGHNPAAALYSAFSGYSRFPALNK